MDILVIGNGFDLAHNLKTSYKDFLDYCEALSQDNKFHSNIWLNYFLHRKETIPNNWIDLEKEIYNFLFKNFKSKNIYPHTFNVSDNYIINYLLQNNVLCIKLSDIKNNFTTAFNSYKKLTDFLYEQLREFTKAFEYYLVNEVLAKMDKNSEFSFSFYYEGIKPTSREVHILSFNYTDTCEQLYMHKKNSDTQINIKPVYVHGKATTSNDCNLVLGTHSFDREHQDKDLSLELNIFQKHNQRHRYATIEAYQKFLRELTSRKQFFTAVFHVIGHSLDKTDHNILRHAFRARPDTVINIYYHNEESLERLINNITEIIGEEEVMTKVRFIHQHNDKRSLLKYKEAHKELIPNQAI